MLRWLLNVLRGACMGIADAIPGVSGGTIALILGIYERFIAAISGIGTGLVRALFTRELWRRLKAGLLKPGAEGHDAPGVHAGNLLFLGTLVIGIGGALVVGARFIPDLLASYPAQMNGFFFGLVLASIAIPLKMLGRRGPRQIIALVLAAAATFVIVDLPLDQSDSARGEVVVTLAAPLAEPLVITPHQERSWFSTNRHGGDDIKREIAFLPERPITLEAGATEATVPVVARLAGRIANLGAGEIVTVHGLPDGARVTQAAPVTGGADPALWFIFIAGVIAISAMVLPGISGSFILLMLGLYNYIFFNLRAFVYDRDTAALAVLIVFAAAVVTGILSFARVVNYCLKRFHDTTIAALVGIMIGSLRKLWPFTDVDATGATHAALPSELDGVFGATVATFVAGVVLVVALERIGRLKLASLSRP